MNASDNADYLWFICLWCNERVICRPDETDDYYPYCSSLCACRADVDSSEPDEV